MHNFVYYKQHVQLSFSKETLLHSGILTYRYGCVFKILSFLARDRAMSAIGKTCGEGLMMRRSTDEPRAVACRESYIPTARESSMAQYFPTRAGKVPVRPGNSRSPQQDYFMALEPLRY